MSSLRRLVILCAFVPLCEKIFWSSHRVAETSEKKDRAVDARAMFLLPAETLRVESLDVVVITKMGCVQLISESLHDPSGNTVVCGLTHYCLSLMGFCYRIEYD